MYKNKKYITLLALGLLVAPFNMDKLTAADPNLTLEELNAWKSGTIDLKRYDELSLEVKTALFGQLPPIQQEALNKALRDRQDKIDAQKTAANVAVVAKTSTLTSADIKDWQGGKFDIDYYFGLSGADQGKLKSSISSAQYAVLQKILIDYQVVKDQKDSEKLKTFLENSKAQYKAATPVLVPAATVPQTVVTTPKTHKKGHHKSHHGSHHGSHHRDDLGRVGVTPAQPAPAQPAHPVPAQPAQSVPAQSIPAQSVPAHSVPAQPAQSTPKKTSDKSSDKDNDWESIAQQFFKGMLKRI